MHRVNQMSEQPSPLYTPQITISTGGTVTGGTEVDYIEALVASQSVSRSSLVVEQEGERGLPGGVIFYGKLTSLSGVNDTSLWVLRFVWTERPVA